VVGSVVLRWLVTPNVIQLYDSPCYSLYMSDDLEKLIKRVLTPPEHVTEDQRDINEAMIDFPFSEEWFDSPQGMSQLVIYCTEKLITLDKVAGPSRRRISRLAKVFEAVEKSMDSTQPFRNAVESTLGTTVASSPRTIVGMADRISIPVGRASSAYDRRSPWACLAPWSSDTFDQIRLIINARPLRQYLASRRKNETL